MTTFIVKYCSELIGLGFDGKNRQTSEEQNERNILRDESWGNTGGTDTPCEAFWAVIRTKTALAKFQGLRPPPPPKMEGFIYTALDAGIE